MKCVGSQLPAYHCIGGPQAQTKAFSGFDHHIRSERWRLNTITPHSFMITIASHISLANVFLFAFASSPGAGRVPRYLKKHTLMLLKRMSALVNGMAHKSNRDERLNLQVHETLCPLTSWPIPRHHSVEFVHCGDGLKQPNGSSLVTEFPYSPFFSPHLV